MQFQSQTSTVFRRGVRRGFITLLREREWKTSFGVLLGVFTLVQLLIVLLLSTQGMYTLLGLSGNLSDEALQTVEIRQMQKMFFELQNFTDAGRSLTIIILVMVTMILMLITTELVRRRVLGRADEVLVEKIVGASPLAMFMPFATEACILLLASTIVSIAGSLFLLSMLPTIVPILTSGGILSELIGEVRGLVLSALPLYFACEILLIPVVAAVGTWLGMCRELLAKTLTLSHA